MDKCKFIKVIKKLIFILIVVLRFCGIVCIRVCFNGVNEISKNKSLLIKFNVSVFCYV